MRKLIFVVWDEKKERYVWSTDPSELPSDDYIEAWVTDLQLSDLRNGGWICAVTRKGIRVKI